MFHCYSNAEQINLWRAPSAFHVAAWTCRWKHQKNDEEERKARMKKEESGALYTVGSENENS